MHENDFKSQRKSKVTFKTKYAKCHTHSISKPKKTIIERIVKMSEIKPKNEVRLIFAKLIRIQYMCVRILLFN